MSDSERRVFCKNAAGWMVGAALLGEMPLLAQQKKTPPAKKKAAPEKVEEVSPAEDLMREHGVLNRILLIYDEAQRRLRAVQDFDPSVVASSAGIIRSFIEDYHEKLEEDFLFPRFEKARRLTELTAVLRAQHRAGRRLTDQIRALATVKTVKDASGRNQLGDALQTFNRMYRPHEAREDTVLFPALHSIVTRNEYDSLGEEFEDKEHQLFGEDGFEKMVSEVAKLEQKFGIYDLARFTPAG
ncbi:MAG TPA: hemerythrin domain-containing protein [Candidatus Acidoferrales bacterium]|nr:hemerythrin domain-containing protein [Candidatus Acidoferrales bacterium]